MFIIVCNDAFYTSHDFDLHGLLQNARCSCKRPFTQTNHLTRWLVLKSILCKYIYHDSCFFFSVSAFIHSELYPHESSVFVRTILPSALKIMSGGTLGPSLGKVANGGLSHCFYGTLTPPSGRNNEERRA